MFNRRDCSIADSKTRSRSQITELETVKQRYPRVSARGLPTQYTSNCRATPTSRHSHACTPVAATGITISLRPALPSIRVRKLRRTESWTLVSGYRPSFALDILAHRILIRIVVDRSQLSSLWVDFLGNFLLIDDGEEEEEEGREDG
jgi:hypothetical protein